MHQWGIIIFACLLSGNAYAGVAVSPKPYVLYDIGHFPITNGMLYTWVISAAIIILMRLFIKNPQLVPNKRQLVVEGIIESI